MMSIFKEWKLVERSQEDNNEQNQLVFIHSFIKDHKIKIVITDEDKPLLDMLMETIRLNWYSFEPF